MYAKPLVLTLLMITSVLAGCLESSDVDDTRITDTTDDFIVDDRSGNATAADVALDEELDSEIIPANPDDCNSGGGTWIEASERGGESYCDMGDENESSETGEITQEDCERRGGTWSEERSTCYFEEDREDDREITQEDCERRNGTWVEASDRSREPYCDFGENDRDHTDDDREITQEDCERRNGTWTETPDRPREYYCDFGDRDSEDREDEWRFRHSNITLQIYHGENLENSAANYTIKIMLNHSAAPIHADNFRKHVLYGNYNNSTFHRIIDDFMIQGGDFQNNTGTGGYAADWYGICNGTRIANQSDCPNQGDWNIPDEANNGLTHLPCTISMAKTADPNTGGSQFFLIPSDIDHLDWLDGIHTVFGEVIEGCDHITTLSQVETGEMDRPAVTVVIFSATVDN